MGIYSNGRLVSVPAPITGATFAYGFRTKIETTSSTALGHTAVTDANLPNTLFGINHPKPRRATKDFAAPRNTETSFIAAASIASARADGWVILAARERNYSNSSRTTLVYVEARTQKTAPVSTAIYKFGWRMPDQQWDVMTEAERTALGIEAVGDDDTDIVYGVTDDRSYPKRAYVRRNIAAEDAPAQFSRISTFVAYNKLDSLPTGWKKMK